MLLRLLTRPFLCPPQMPEGLAVIILMLHIVVWPISITGFQLLQPSTTISNRAFRESNEDTLEAIWTLVENMHYGRDRDAHLLWGDRLDSLISDDLTGLASSAKAALRSEIAFGRMTKGLLGALRDPYSTYSSESDLELAPVANTFGLSLAHEHDVVANAPAASLTLPSTASSAAAPPSDASGSVPAVPRLIVSGVLPDSPAESAGLRAGDVVVAIDGVEAAPSLLGVADIRSLLQSGSDPAPAQGDGGEELRTLRLQVLRNPASAKARPRASRGVRADRSGERPDGRTPQRTGDQNAAAEWISLREQPAADSWIRTRLLPRGIGYVRIRQFTEMETDEFVGAIAALKSNGARGWVLDLRNNPGGQLTEAMLQAALLLPPDSDDTVAYTLDAAGHHLRHGTSDVRAATKIGASDPREVASLGASANDALEADAGSTPGPGPYAQVPWALVPPDAPLVILVDGGTASSAELFAAALRDNGRGVLVGESTYGKSLIQRIFPMPNGGALKLTIGEYLTPLHDRISPGNGLRPEISCAATPTLGDDECLTLAARLASDSAGTTHMTKRLGWRLPHAPRQPLLSQSSTLGWKARARGPF